MSKAFTKDDEEAPVIVPARAPLPPGAPNYVTVSGLRALRREHAALVGRELDERARLAMVWTILCGERWASVDPASAGRDGGQSFFAHAAAARAKLLRQACSAVPPPAASAGRAQPSSVPVLLLAGSADPLDPPLNVHGWHAEFPNGRLVTVPGLAHGTVAHGCLRLLVARFIAAGDARGLDASCTRHVPLPRFELS